MGNFGGNTEEEAYEAWLNWISEKYRKHVINIELNEHPKYIQERLKNLDSTQFGYDCFGLKDNVRRDALELIKKKNFKIRNLKWFKTQL